VLWNAADDELGQPTLKPFFGNGPVSQYTDQNHGFMGSYGVHTKLSLLSQI
jgi:hypothetical protein